MILCHLNFNIPIHKHKALLDTFKVNVMADQLKLCCVVLDELEIKENVSSNPEHDEVEDFGDAGKLKYFANRCVYVGRFSM